MANDLPPLISRLLAGPEDTELNDRELAVLAAWLRRPVSLQTIQQEKKRYGVSHTLREREKLRTIQRFNEQRIEAERKRIAAKLEADVKAEAEAPPKPAAPGERPAVTEADPAKAECMARLLAVFTNGVSDERLRNAAELLDDAALTVDEKLRRLDKGLPIPSNATAQQLGYLVKVSRQAIAQTEWWKERQRFRRGDEATDFEARKRRLHE